MSLRSVKTLAVSVSLVLAAWFGVFSSARALERRITQGSCRLLLETASASQEFLDALQPLGVHPILRRNHFLHDVARAVDDVRFRQLERPIACGDVPIGIARGFELHLELI